jgi:hypothetical protein
MAFKRDTAALFGGVPSLANPAPTGNTWTWNGRVWTERQDIGPRPRWLHAIAFDSDRNHLVLFGGTAANGVADVGNQDRGLCDTWEPSDDVAAQAPPGVDLLSLTQGSLDTAVLTLTGPAPAGGVVVQLVTMPPAAIQGVARGTVSVPTGERSVVLQLEPGFGTIPVTVTATLGTTTKQVTINI